MNACFPNPLDYLAQVSRSTDEPCFECGEWRCTCKPRCDKCDDVETLNDDGLCAWCEPLTECRGDPLKGKA